MCKEEILAIVSNMDERRKLSTLGGRTSHRQHGHTRLTTATTFRLIVYSMASHGAYIQMAFLSWDSRVGVPKLRQMGLS